MFPAIELQERTDILTRTWKLCERQLDKDILEGALAATSELALPQLRVACVWVTRNDPKGPLVRAILGCVDRATKASQSRAGSEKELMVVPYIKGADPERVRFYRRPAGYQWTPFELMTIYSELGCDPPESLRQAVEREASDGYDLDPAVWGPPPDPNNHATPTPERQKQLMAQLHERLRKMGAVKRPPRGVTAADMNRNRTEAIEGLR